MKKQKSAKMWGVFDENKDLIEVTPLRDVAEFKSGHKHGHDFKVGPVTVSWEE